MKDLSAILREASGSTRLKVNGGDLPVFSSNLINRSKEELATQVAEVRKTKDRSRCCMAYAMHNTLALEPERVSVGRQDRQQDKGRGTGLFNSSFHRSIREEIHEKFPAWETFRRVDGFSFRKTRLPDDPLHLLHY